MKKRIFAVVFSIFCVVASFKLGHKVMPELDFQPKISKEEILKIANKEAEKFGFANRNVINIISDATYINYVSRKMNHSCFEEFYTKYKIEPMSWHIRYFKEGQIEELQLFYTLDGKLRGFRKNLSENTQDKNLSKSKARALAINELKRVSHEGIYFNEKQFTEIEYFVEEKPSKRIDHKFIFESKYKIGEGKHRHCVVISGSTISNLSSEVRFPDTFISEFSDIRSKNNIASSIGNTLFFLSAICLVILFFKFASEGKIAFKFSLVSAAVLTISQLNFNIYAGYLPTSNLFVHALNHILIVLFFSIFTFLLAAVTISTVLALNEEIFPKHINFRSIFTSKFLASKEYLNLVLQGYVFACVKLLGLVGFYIFVNTYFKWYVGIQFKGTSFGDSFAFIQPIAASVNAGLIEELMFRGFFISIGYLLYKRYKNRFILPFFFILQACLFGLVHTNYAQTPFYFRIVELIPISLIYGLAFYTGGFIVPVIAHWFYDFILMSAEIFNTPKVFKFNLIPLILFGLLPILVHIYFRYYKKIEGNIVLNEDVEQVRANLKTTLPLKEVKSSMYLSLAILILLPFTILKSKTTRINVVKAKQVAEAFLKSKNFEISKTYLTVSDLSSSIYSLLKKRDDAFWKETYKNSTSPEIRFTSNNFEKKLTHLVRMNLNLDITGYFSYYSEDIKLLSSTENEAKNIAFKEIEERFGIKNLFLISSYNSVYKNRVEWHFKFKTTEDVEINCTVANKQVITLTKHLFISEEISLKYIKISSLLQTLNFLSIFVIIGVIITVCLILAVNFKISLKRSYISLFITFILLKILSIFNFKSLNLNMASIYQNENTTFYTFFSSSTYTILFQLLGIFILISLIESFKLKDRLSLNKILLSLIFPITSVLASTYLSAEKININPVVFSAKSLNLAYLNFASSIVFVSSIIMLSVVILIRYFDRKYLTISLLIASAMFLNRDLTSCKALLSLLIYIASLYVSFKYLWQNSPITVLLSSFFLYALRNVSLIFSNMFIGYILFVLITGNLIYRIFEE